MSLLEAALRGREGIMLSVRSTVGAEVRHVAAARKTALFQQGDVADAIFRVERGCLRLEVTSQSGRRDIVAFLFPGDVFSAGLGERWASAYAVDDALLTRFPTTALNALLPLPSEEAATILVAGDALLAQIARRLRLIGEPGSVARVRGFLHWLVERSGSGSGQVRLPMTRRDIADFLGMAPETVSRAFVRLEARGELQRLPEHICRLRAPSEGRTEEGP